MGSSALVSVVTGLVEVVGSLERSCPVCGAGSAGLAAGFSSVFSREAFAFPGEEISLSFLPEPAAVSLRGWARVVVFLLLGSLVVGVLSSDEIVGVAMASKTRLAPIRTEPVPFLRERML
ncbi:Uncharacterised protein [Streptococcus pneumoniae]|nr:Uncharacterised protein [Streptococcus pneumoniae]CJD61117.1 Uncharacterised protein [Streptococcus pneumoniae]